VYQVGNNNKKTIYLSYIQFNKSERYSVFEILITVALLRHWQENWSHPRRRRVASVFDTKF